MFGCQTLIKQHKIGGKIVTSKSNEGPLGMVKVFTIDYLREKLDFDADSLVLFAMLAGGDYDLTGLRGCGQQTARLVCRRENGVASALCHASKEHLPVWREHLFQTLFAVARQPIEVPYTFPDWKALGHYRNPTVSTEGQLRTLRGLRQGWDVPMKVPELRVFLRERFNFGTREFLKHIIPIFLVRALASATPDQRQENLQYGCQKRRTRAAKPKDGEDPPVKSETKITFSPLFNLQIDVSRMPVDEDWSKWTAKDGTPYDPTQDLEFEILDCFLRHGLPDDWHAADTPNPPRKRKAPDTTPSSSIDPNSQNSPAKKKQRRSSGHSEHDASPSISVSLSQDSHNARNGSASRSCDNDASLPAVISSSQNKSATSKKKRKTDDKASTPSEKMASTAKDCPPARPKFKIPRIVTSTLLDAAVECRIPPASAQVAPPRPQPSPPSSHILDLDDFNSGTEVGQSQNASPESVHQSNYGVRSYMPATSPSTATSASILQPTKTTPVVPGNLLDPVALRALRQKSSLLKGPAATSIVQKAKAWMPSSAEIIDLT